jgi:hypothetical protein
LPKLRALAERAVNRLRSVYGTEYQVGTGADLLAPASGGSDDWAKESLGIRYVYLVELRPHNDCKFLKYITGSSAFEISRYKQK